MYKPSPIRDIDEQFRRTAVITGMILAAAGTLLIWDPQNPLVRGFLLGGLCGLFNAKTLVRRMHAMAGLDARRANNLMKQGSFMRMALVIALALLASRTEAISLFGVGAGLLTVTLITATDALFSLGRYFAARGAVDRI
ncbi:MAG: ATP synthase subunit I [Bacillota bacterium]|jgi:hypothetical protein